MVVMPSCAVTTMVIVFKPTFKGRFPDAVPDVTAVDVPLFNATFTVAVGSRVVGVMVMLVTALPTDAE